MTEFSQEVIADVLRTYAQTRNSPFKTSRLTGLDVADVFAIVDANQHKISVAQERFGGKGRPEIESFTVVRRRATDREWDNKDPQIVQARADYEAGTHEMATGRDGPWLILYSFPRRWPTKPRIDYFRPEQAS